MSHRDQMHGRAAEQPRSTAEHADDDYYEGAFYLAALCCASVVLVVTLGALSLIGGCR
jgi:hypothetical protein